MHEENRVPVGRILPRTGAGTLSSAEARALLKVAFLAGEADGRIDDEEERSFQDLAHALRDLAPAGDASMSDQALDEMLDAFGDRVDAKGRSAALKEIVKELGRPLVRELAYKVAVAMSVADLDRRDEEVDFDDQLLEALGLWQDQASLLAEDVYTALDKG